MSKSRRQSQLKSIQSQMLGFVTRPLNNEYRLREFPKRGRFSRQALDELIKSNDILNSAERLELYSRQYWFRLIDSLIEDFPGVRAILGTDVFDPLIEAYIARYPSRSFTMRNLGDRFPYYLASLPEATNAQYRSATDMARLEWAKIEAFDSEERSSLPPARSSAVVLGPITLQPYIRLLQLYFPVDDWLIRLNREEWHATASNAVDANSRRRKHVNARPLLRRKRVHVVVHRHNFRVYFKRVEPEAFAILQRLQVGVPIEQVLESVYLIHTRSLRWWQRKLPQWFADWSSLGWLTLK